MLTEEIKLTKHHKLYDVLMTHSQPIESTQGTYKTPSAPRPPNPKEQQGESSAAKKYLIIRIPKRKKPDPETPILTVDGYNVDANKFVNDIINSQEDPGTRIEPGSHKERL
ncbi:hypothetical protein Tco_1228861 [Tanacetum coccineum]